MKQININDLMNSSGVQFGTSGVRGLVSEMTDEVCWLYVTAFLQHLTSQNIIQHGDQVAVAGDLRNSTARIMLSVFTAIIDFGLEPINCGTIPSPAIALYGLHKKIATIMVTGSHIPDDRNGIKFNSPYGEILKADEVAIREQIVTVPQTKFDSHGMLFAPVHNLSVSNEASEHYETRFLDFFPQNCLQGKHIGVYQHSSVARDCVTSLLQKLGATVVPLGRSDDFIAVDTEAIRSEDVELAELWTEQYNFDCIVSTDGDGDRPLISDEKGQWLRGDVAGILCAQYLNAEVVVTPVSSNTSVEKCGSFKQVIRTKIGSPYVISAMNEFDQDINTIGYEANGGFLQAGRIDKNRKRLNALPTRDAIIVMLSILLLAKQQQLTVSELVATLPQRFTYSDRLKNFPTEVSQKWLTDLTQGDKYDVFEMIKQQFGFEVVPVELDCTDGVRITFENADIVHFRPSGNAPELRCYTESNSEEKAKNLNGKCLRMLSSSVVSKV